MLAVRLGGGGGGMGGVGEWLEAQRAGGGGAGGRGGRSVVARGLAGRVMRGIFFFSGDFGGFFVWFYK